MSTYYAIPQIFRSLAIQLPILLVCLVAGIVVLAKWRQGACASIWALAGFGLALFLSFAIPITQQVVHSWVMQDGNPARLDATLLGLAVLWSVLRAISYILLLAAVFAGRSALKPVAPPPFNGVRQNGLIQF
jgi:Na+/glutamate symporter